MHRQTLTSGLDSNELSNVAARGGHQVGKFEVCDLLAAAAALTTPASNVRDVFHLDQKGKDAAMSEMQQGAWTKPAAMAIPKGGFSKDKVEQGRYGPIFPKTPACYGFSILAKIIPGREEVFL